MRIIPALFLFALTSVWFPQAKAEPVSLQGEWHQIASNAGKCADCRISIGRNGTDFSVTANNGWSAVVRPGHGPIHALGKGRWKPNFGGPYGGRPFLLNIGVVDGKLFMIMTVSKPDGSVSEITAAFEKRTPAGEAI